MIKLLLRLFAIGLAWLPLALVAPDAHAAEGIEVQSARIEGAIGEDSWLLGADFSAHLPATLVEAVNHGVSLYFELEFELSRPRWYWWDEKISLISRSTRLTYHALTRQYRVAQNGQTEAFDSLEDSLAYLCRIRGLPVLAFDRLTPGVEYGAAVRMRLDVSMLPKPLQVTALTNREWNLPSEWKRWKFTP